MRALWSRAGDRLQFPDVQPGLYDDVALLLRSGVSFIAFEDTGKSFPTLDAKASLIYSSPDLAKRSRNFVQRGIFMCLGYIAAVAIARI